MIGKYRSLQSATGVCSYEILYDVSFSPAATSMTLTNQRFLKNNCVELVMDFPIAGVEEKIELRRNDRGVVYLALKYSDSSAGLCDHGPYELRFGPNK